jgi:hypothetical protein
MAGAAMEIVSAGCGRRHQIGSAAQRSGPVGGELGGYVLAADVCVGRGVDGDCRHSGASQVRSFGGERQGPLGRDRRPVRKDRCCTVAGS